MAASVDDSQCVCVYSVYASESGRMGYFYDAEFCFVAAVARLVSTIMRPLASTIVCDLNPM